ncbi:MAG TPA: CRTAC1 family protein [Candidatus Polarisedimenticolia bacterium]|nr:CRTAC1 family protein [Candidatus Polarisedimenticolia bacterium]
MTRRDLLSLFVSLGAVAQITKLKGGSLFKVDPPKGVDFVLRNSPTPRKYLIETMPGGIALLDYNNDGFLDVFLVNAGRVPARMRSPVDFDRRNPSYWNRLYRQNKDKTFTDVTAQAGLQNAGDANYGMGVAVGDYDNDGFPDIYVTNFGKNVLYHNNGDGTFTDVTAKAGVAAGGWSASAGFFDYDNDGNLDLFVTRYLDWTPETSKTCGRVGDPMYCPPGEFPPTTNILYRNRGNGTFEDVSADSGIAAKKGHGLGVAFADYDSDGFTDIFVANDATEQFLFHNNGNGTFTEVALDSGAALSSSGKMPSGMGVVFQDYDNDGLPDLLVTQLPHEPYVVFHNDGKGSFSAQELETGFGAISGKSSGWGVGLEDFDNDGWKDAFIVQGHVFDNVEMYDSSLRYRDAPLLALNYRGHFEKGDLGSNLPTAGRGAAFGDLNNDGWIDVVTTSLGERPQFYLNRGGKLHWLTITLRGKRSNRDGFGARVQVNGQTRFATAAGSYLSSNDKRLHFGIGKAESADVEIRWPSGVHQVLHGVKANQFITIEESERS